MEDERKQQETEAAYNWLPIKIKDITQRYEGQETNLVVRDAYLSNGQDKIDGKWVVDGSKHNFGSRLGTLMAEDDGCREIEEKLKNAIRPVKPFSKLMESLNNEMRKADPRTGKVTISEFVPIVVEEEDFPALRVATEKWLEKIWSLREGNGLINEYMKSMSFLDNEVSGVVPPMTFDEFANDAVRNLVARELSDYRFYNSLRDEGLKNALETNEDLKNLVEMDKNVIRDKALEIIMDSMTQWQLNQPEVTDLRPIDSVMVERMNKADKLRYLVKRYKDTGDKEVLAEVEQFFNKNK